MSRYKRYERYKDSGIEWIGEIPEHWEVSKLKYLTYCLDGKRIPLSSEQRGEIQISEAVTGKIDVREFQNKNEVIFRNE